MQKLEFMKKIISILFVLTTLAACTEKTETAAPAQNSYTLVFFDKTASVNPNDSFVMGKYSAALKNLVDKNINKEGDLLEAYFIHENTSKARALTIKSRTPQGETSNLSPADKEAANLSYEINIKKERQLIYNALIEKLLENNTSTSNAETNVGDSVPVMARALDLNSSVNAYFFSDMIESMNNGRDFHRMAPISYDQAEKWAKEDVKKYTEYSLINTDIDVILPFSPNSSSKINNPNISDYWKVFFDQLGAKSVNEQ